MTMATAALPRQPAAARATMRAAVVRAPGEIEVVHAPLPAPGPRQIRVRLEGCGVCASNIPPFEGRAWFKYPMAPGALGHEGWGVIDEVGAEVEDFAPGERVAILSNNAYAEWDVADAGAAVRLPGSLRDRPFPAEPLGCAMNIFGRSGVGAGNCIAIVGMGFLGVLLAQLCRQAGARVLALSRRPFSLEIARQHGAHQVIGMDDRERAIEAVGAATGGRFCDVVIEAVGKEEALNLAAELTRERGRLIVAGYHQDGLRCVNMQLWNWRGLDVINAHERDPAVYRQGMEAAVQAVDDGRMVPWGLFTHRFALEDLGAALRMTRERPDGFMKALIEMERGVAGRGER